MFGKLDVCKNVIKANDDSFIKHTVLLISYASSFYNRGASLCLQRACTLFRNLFPETVFELLSSSMRKQWGGQWHRAKLIIRGLMYKFVYFKTRLVVMEIIQAKKRLHFVLKAFLVTNSVKLT